VPAKTGVLSLTLGCVLVLTGPALAQQFTRTEIGIVTSLLPDNRLLSVTDAGIGARFTYNLTSSFAVDSEVDSYPTNTGLALTSLQDGGRATSFVIGPKVGIRGRRYSIFFKARPGFMSFGDTFTSVDVISNSLATARKTHATLDLGVASEFATSTRAVLRFDIGTLLVRYGDATLFSFHGASARTVGRVEAPWHLGVGIGYRLGNLEAAEGSSPSSRPEHFQFGGQYSLMTLERSAQTVRDESAIGGWFTWNFNRYVGLDSSFSCFPRQVRFVDFQQGGRIVQVLAGIRSGVRRGRLGVFGKFRPGLQLYTLTVQNQQTQNLTPFANFAFDVGGIIEVYTSRHTLLRFDAGNTIIRYRARSTIEFDGGVFQSPGFTKPTIQLTSGFGFRF
jgi:hypothetical protein